MVIKSLKLKNYRNYDLEQLNFDPATNILYGDNAQERPISWRPFICPGRPNPTGDERQGSDPVRA